jgi:hypothetical protein
MIKLIIYKYRRVTTMGKSILPSGEDLKTTPEEVLRYVNPDGLRQILRQSRRHWNLKPNKDADYYDNQTLHKYTGELHNEAQYQRMEIRTFPDNGAAPGYAGINVDSGVFGLQHGLENWDHALSEESKQQVINRMQVGAMATVSGKKGYGLDDTGSMSKDTSNRQAAILFDPYDGRAYIMSNDDVTYVNNETRKDQLPRRTIARIADIPTRITDLKNDLDFVSDPDYHHTDNNFTNSNRFILDNIDDRTFVYPEISKNKSGEYLENYRVGLAGESNYGESDGNQQYNTQFGYEDRIDNVISSYNINNKFSGVNHKSGYLPAVFRSVEELNKVDLVGQLRTPLTHKDTPGAKRTQSYYIFDGIWSPTWFDRYQYKDSYLAQSLHPGNMELILEHREPTPFSQINQKEDTFKTSKLYQWRYNRITIKYDSKDIIISIVESGQEYKVGDILRWTFGDDVFLYEVTLVGPNGQIQKGKYHPVKERIFEQDPSTYGVGIPFSNMSGVGNGAKLSLLCKASIETSATQLKNNLYAYVDITPSVRSDNTSEWSDVNAPDTQDGLVNVKSTAGTPAYSGVNSGRGGPSPSSSTSAPMLHEHGGNATAGVHVHLFRYVIDTQTPSWVTKDGVQVFTGKWVDQGPMGVERPCDIKALLFSNPDTNNFNNYYKFMLDNLFDAMNRIPDAVTTNNPNALSQAYIHTAQRDPEPNQRFTENRINPNTSKVETVDVTDKVFYLNGATGVLFTYNTSYKNDPSFGYGSRPPGWQPVSGTITR